MFKRKPIKILKHHRASSVYIEGRYLVVESRTSLKSKRGREIALETATEIHDAVIAAMSEAELALMYSHRENTSAEDGGPLELGARVRDHEGRD